VQSSFEVGDLRCFASPSDTTLYSFLPKTPGLARDPEGRPALTLIEAGSSGYLLLTATWGATDRDLTALRRELAHRTDQPDDSRIRLSFASLTPPRCTAHLGDGSGAFQTLATRATSGVPPYDATFHLPLRDERLAHAKAALRGEPGFLGLEYLADLRLPVRGTATFQSLAGDLLPWLGSRAGGARDLRPLLDEAVAEGLAAVAVEGPDPQPSPLAGELYDRVLARAAELLPRWLEQRGAGTLHVAVTLEQSVREPVRAFSDVGVIVSSEPVRSATGGHDAAN
jgi:hypothetical protein